MYCPKCGKEMPDEYLHCPGCGCKMEKKVQPMTPPAKKKKGCGCALLTIFLIVAAVNIIGEALPSDEGEKKKETAKTESSPSKENTQKKHRAEISGSAIYLYPETAKGMKEKGFPKMFQKYGIEGIKKINKLMPKVAEKAAENTSMDRIVRVDVSDNRSTKDKLVFYVDAENRNRIYISESDLGSNAKVYSDQEKLRLLLPLI